MVFPTHIVAAAGVVLNAQGQVLLVKTHNNGWVFPGGQVENGETLMDGATREILEESGVTVTVDTLFAVSSNVAAHEGYNGVKTVPTKVMFDFICTYVSGQLQTSEENSETQWFDKQEALDAITSPPIKERYKAYLNFNGQVQYLAYISKPEFDLKLARKI